MPKNSNAAFYEQNAKRGRTVRFSMNVDINHVPDEEAKKHGLGASVKIAQGTLTPAAARQVLDLVLDIVTKPRPTSVIGTAEYRAEPTEAEQVAELLKNVRHLRQRITNAKGTDKGSKGPEELDAVVRLLGLRRWHPTGCSERYDEPESDVELRARALRVLGGE